MAKYTVPNPPRPSSLTLVAADVARQFGLVHVRQKVSKQRRLALEEAIEVIARV